MLGFSRFPACDAILRFFGRFTQGAVEECFRPLFRWLLTLLSPPAGGFSLELDSTILQRKGSQEGALRGYNPRRPGRNSHHPLLAVLAEMPLVLHAWLRSGNTCSGRGVCAFLCEALALLPDSWRLRYVRADCLALPPGAHPCGAAPSPGCLAPLGCGFFDGALLDFHEKRAIPYIIVARMSTQIRRSLHSASLVWRDVDGTYSVSSFTEKLHGRKDTRRFVVVRARLREDKAAVGCKLIDVPGYTFSLWVTSRTDDAMHLWRDYNLRSAVFVCGALLGRAGRRLVLRLGQNTGGIEKHNPLIAKALDAGKAIAPLLPKRTHPPPLHHETDHPACLL